MNNRAKGILRKQLEKYGEFDITITDKDMNLSRQETLTCSYDEAVVEIEKYENEGSNVLYYSDSGYSYLTIVKD